MSLKNLSTEKKSKMSLIELTRLMMLEEKKEMKFKDAFNRAADLKGLSESQRGGRISQYYTDLNVDGNFITSGSNMWGLKSWYQDKKEEEEEEAVIPRKAKRRRNKKRDDDDLASEFAMIDSHIDEVSDEYVEEDDELELDLDGDFGEEFDEDDED